MSTTDVANGAANGNGTASKPSIALRRASTLANLDGQMQMNFRDVSYTIVVADKDAPKSRVPNPFAKKPTKEKVILNKVSGIFRPGRMTAIMGASGAGKTSLVSLIPSSYQRKMLLTHFNKYSCKSFPAKPSRERCKETSPSTDNPWTLLR